VRKISVLRMISISSLVCQKLYSDYLSVLFFAKKEKKSVFYFCSKNGRGGIFTNIGSISEYDRKNYIDNNTLNDITM